jgi:hypothetical protein
MVEKGINIIYIQGVDFSYTLVSHNHMKGFNFETSIVDYNNVAACCVPPVYSKQLGCRVRMFRSVTEHFSGGEGRY